MIDKREKDKERKKGGIRIQERRKR